VLGVAGTWKDLTDSVNSMLRNLTAQVRNLRRVDGHRHGDLSKRSRRRQGRDPGAERHINHHGDQLNAFAGEVTRVAREVGTKASSAARPSCAASRHWKDLTDSVNSMASNLTGQVRNIAELATAVAQGDPFQKITARLGEILQLADTINTMVDPAQCLAPR